MKKDSTYNDPLQELLRRHLLETDGNEEKADLLNRISEKAMQSEPSLVMSEAKKAEMLLRLKNQLPPPGPGGGTGSGLSGWTIPSIAGLVLLSVTAFFFLKKPAEDTIQKTEIKSEQNTAVSDELLNKETAHTDNISGDLNDPDFVLQPGKQSIDPNQKNNLAVSGTDPGKSATNLTYSVPVPGGLPSVPPDKPFSFFELIQSTSTVPLTKKMSPGRELFIAGDGGTVFYFPANCFADQNGKVVTDEISIQIIECTKKNEAIRNHMSTNFRDGYLESGGMFKIDAQSNGKKLKLAEGMSYYVEFPSLKGNQMFIYDGFRDEEGSLTWNMSRNQDRILVPLPIGEINFLQFLSPVKGKKEWDGLIRMLNNKNFEGTFIATREFVQRLSVARRMGYAFEILQIYMDNLGLNMHEIDEMVAYNLRGSYKNYEHKEQGAFGNEDFDEFAQLKLKKPIPFKDRGLDLSQADAREKLREAGASLDEIESTMLVYSLRKSILNEINGPIEEVIRKKLPHEKENGIAQLTLNKESIFVWGSQGVSWAPRSRSTGFRLSKLGEINLDCPVPSGPKSDVIVQLPAHFNKQNCKLYFLFPGRNVSMAESKPDKTGKATFNNLPVKSGKIICMGTYMGQAWYAEQNVNFNGEAFYPITPEQLSNTAYMNKVASLGNW